MKIDYKNTIKIEDYVKLIGSAGWKELSIAQIEKSLKNTSYLTVTEVNGSAVGMARFITEFSFHGLLFDVVVLPQFMGKGIGRQLINNVLEFVKSLLVPGEQFLIELLPSAGKRNFYLNCGFKYKPEKMDGMYLWVKK